MQVIDYVEIVIVYYLLRVGGGEFGVDGVEQGWWLSGWEGGEEFTVGVEMLGGVGVSWEGLLNIIMNVAFIDRLREQTATMQTCFSTFQPLTDSIYFSTDHFPLSNN